MTTPSSVHFRHSMQRIRGNVYALRAPARSQQTAQDQWNLGAGATLQAVGVTSFSGGESARMFRYLLSGAVAWVADLAVFTACLGSFGIIMAQLIARITGAVVAFFGHKLFVFGESDIKPATLARQIPSYAALWLLSYVVSTLALIGLVGHVGMQALLAKIMVEAVIIAMNYLVMKTLIFRSGMAGGPDQ